MLNTVTNPTNNENLLKNADIQKIAEEGAKLYGKIKVKYDPKEKGKFLAIDIESKKAYLGNASAKALELARSKHPNRIFYVVKIGFDVAETMAKSLMSQLLLLSFQWKAQRITSMF